MNTIIRNALERISDSVGGEEVCFTTEEINEIERLYDVFNKTDVVILYRVIGPGAGYRIWWEDDTTFDVAKANVVDASNLLRGRGLPDNEIAI